MLRDIDNYFLNKDEPVKGCLLFLREFVLAFDSNLTEAWKYGMPFYCYRGKMFCYLWVDKKMHNPYLGIVDGNKIDHPLLVMEKRARMKTIQFDARQDVPVDVIREILGMALALRR